MFALFERYGLATAMSIALMIFVVTVVDRKLDVIVAATTVTQQMLINRAADHQVITEMIMRHIDISRDAAAQVEYLLRAQCLNSARGQDQINRCAGPRP
jgi:hypothetical protein